MEDSIDVEALHTTKHFGRVGDVSMVETEVPFIIEHAGIVQ